MSTPNDPLRPPARAPLEESEEVVHYDDAVMGRVFRYSLGVLAIAGLASGALVWYVRSRPVPPPPQLAALQAPPPREPVSAGVPVARFEDVTDEAGIRFSHFNGAYGEKLLPETMGGGVAFADLDADGDADLLFVNSSAWPWHPGAQVPPSLVLYLNDGTGRFTDATQGSGLEVDVYGMGVAVGDYDNDGLADVCITGVGGNRLFHNEGGGRFRDVTGAAGVAGEASDWSSCAAWLDYDNDGDLDLFVGHYVRWTRELDIEVGYKLVGVGRAYGPPMNFEGTFPSLFRNEGSGRFTDVTAAAGLEVRNPATGVPAAKTLGVAPVDLDGDGWLDLVLANDTVQNFVFHNQRDGTFREIGAVAGLAFDTYGNTRGAMGIDAARYRDDGALGIAIGNFANEMTALYVAQKAPLTFADEAITEGVGPASRLLLKFGIFFFDYDLDGWLDLLSVNGHLEDEIQKVQASQTFAQPAQLFWNADGAGFEPVPPEKAGAALFVPMVGRGSAYADMDGDGDLDVVLTQVGRPARLLRNVQELGHHWLRVRVTGRRCNRSAIGATVKLEVEGRVLTREVMPTRSYLSQSEFPVTFGLGKNDRAGAVTVRWPGGEVQTVAVTGLDREVTVEQNP